MKITRLMVIVAFYSSLAYVDANGLTGNQSQNRLVLEIQNNCYDIAGMDRFIVELVRWTSGLSFGDRLDQALVLPAGYTQEVTFPFYVVSNIEPGRKDTATVRISTENKVVLEKDLEIETGEFMPGVGEFYFTAYPNPSRGTVNFSWQNLVNKRIHLKLYNILGQMVFATQLKNMSSSIKWFGTDQNGKTMGSGVFFYYLMDESNNCVQSGKLVMVR